MFQWLRNRIAARSVPTNSVFARLRIQERKLASLQRQVTDHETILHKRGGNHKPPKEVTPLVAAESPSGSIGIGHKRRVGE